MREGSRDRMIRKERARDDWGRNRRGGGEEGGADKNEGKSEGLDDR